MSGQRRLRLVIEFPGYYVDAADEPEDVAVAMALTSEQVICVFHADDSEDGAGLRQLEGYVIEYGITSASPSSTEENERVAGGRDE